MSNLVHFQGEMVNFFPQKYTLKSESVNLSNIKLYDRKTYYTIDTIKSLVN